MAGLSAAIPAIPARWLYDRRGSELFDRITKLPSYYPTRTETDLLQSLRKELGAAIPPGLAVVEFGAGSQTKTPILLESISPAAYVPIDISGAYLELASEGTDQRFSSLQVFPVTADFTGPMSLPQDISGLPKLGFFPGSTIGNFVPQSAVDLLRNFRELLGTGALLLIGLDRIKAEERLILAYDEPEGVTAEFNLNLLHRINRELGADIDVAAFRHEARWNALLARIEMHLVAVRDVAFSVSDTKFDFPAGSSIHTENSHKYDERSARLLLLAGGWTPVREWTDPAGDFSIALAQAQPPRFAP